MNRRKRSAARSGSRSTQSAASGQSSENVTTMLPQPRREQIHSEHLHSEHLHPEHLHPVGHHRRTSSFASTSTPRPSSAVTENRDPMSWLEDLAFQSDSASNTHDCALVFEHTQLLSLRSYQPRKLEWRKTHELFHDPQRWLFVSETHQLFALVDLMLEELVSAGSISREVARDVKDELSYAENARHSRLACKYTLVLLATHEKLTDFVCMGARLAQQLNVDGDRGRRIIIITLGPKPASVPAGLPESRRGSGGSDSGDARRTRSQNQSSSLRSNSVDNKRRSSALRSNSMDNPKKHSSGLRSNSVDNKRGAQAAATGGKPSHMDLARQLILVGAAVATVTADDEFLADMLCARSPASLGDHFIRYVQRAQHRKRRLTMSAFETKKDLDAEEAARQMTLSSARFHMRLYMHKHFPHWFGQHRNSSDSLQLTGSVGAAAALDADLASPGADHNAQGVVQATGRPFGGLWADLRSRLAWHSWSTDWFWPDMDWRIIMFSVPYLLFSTLVPTVAFGGLLQSITHAQMGLSEIMLAQSCVGILFALLGGNGLAILRPTGPVVAFISVVVHQSESLHLPFLDLWAWVCIWLAVWCVALAASDASALIRYVSQMTEEIFAALISVIFMKEALEHASDYVVGSQHDAIAPLSLVLLVLAFYIAQLGESFRVSKYLGSRTRVSVFVVSGILAVLLPTILAAVTRGKFWGQGSPAGVDLLMLDVPQEISDAFVPTGRVLPSNSTDPLVYCLSPIGEHDISSNHSTGPHFVPQIPDVAAAAAADHGSAVKRAWLAISSHNATSSADYNGVSHHPEIVDLSDCVPRTWWLAFGHAASYRPELIGHGCYLGLLLAILFYVEQNVTTLLMASPVNKLKKKMTFHWDIMLSGLLAGVCGMLGLPVAHPCLPHSILHVHALSAKEEEVVDGQIHRVVLRVCETRLSALLVNVLILLTMFLLPYMGEVPLPVLYGMFLFYGVSSLASNPFWQRVVVFFTDPRLYPPHHVIRRVRHFKVHLYTFIQLLWLGLIFGCKMLQATSPYFPLLIVATVPFRFWVMPFIFTPGELLLLDSDDGHGESHQDDRQHRKKG